MKKIYLILASLVSCFLFTSANAQSTTDSGFHFEVGPSLATPMRTLALSTSFGIGIDGAAITTIADNVSVGGRINYSYFIGQKALLEEEAHGASIVNVLGEGRYSLPYNIFAGLDLGVGFETSNGHSDTEFARIFNLGYVWDQSKAHTFVFSVYFDQTTYQKALGVRAAIRL